MLTERIDTTAARVAELAGRYKALNGHQYRLEENEDGHRYQYELHEKALNVLQQLEGAWRGKYEEALAALGSQGLSSIWGDTREVTLQSSIKRGVAHLDIAMVKDGEQVRLKGGSGGSVVQVLSSMLRILTTIGHRPELRLLFALDEPYSMVAAQQRPALCEFLQGLREQLGFQLVFSAHEDELLEAADRAYFVEPDDKGTLKEVS